MTQPTDEAAVDIVERLLNDDDLYTRDVAASMIKTLRAQLTAATAESRRFKALAEDHFRNAQQIAERLTAATRRAEQAERMLAEVGAKIDEALLILRNPVGSALQTVSSAILSLAHAQATIRSAASGEQG